MDVVSATLLNASRKPPIRSDSDLMVTEANSSSGALQNPCNQSQLWLYSTSIRQRFGSIMIGNEEGPSTTTSNSHRPGSLQTTLRASSVKGESTQKDWRVFQLVVRTSSETAVVIIGSLGRWWIAISCKLGHNVERVVITEAVAALWGPRPHTLR